MARVLVAMSGGVDSSVAAARLLDDGHDVVGVTLKLWGGAGDRGCCTVADVDDARSVTRRLGIEHHVFNLGEAFEADVVAPYVADHAAGRTPNPCIECNRHIKFDRLLRRAEALGFDLLATGHHARVARGPAGGFRLARGADRAKDQSYVLHTLGPDALARVAFPVGDLTKDQVRAEADRLGLVTADKPDSQDVCFITATGGRRAFLGPRIGTRRAPVFDTAGHEVGEVDAVELVTIGQRRGLNLPGGGERRYVVDVDVAAPRVTVGTADELDRREIGLTGFRWADAAVAGTVSVQRSAHGSADPGIVVLGPAGTAGSATVVLDAPAPRVAPGQSVVLYQDDQVVGSGLAT
jgi:tRNA-uridine 2-sulfurtransferase